MRQDEERYKVVEKRREKMGNSEGTGDSRDKQKECERDRGDERRKIADMRHRERERENIRMLR